MASEVRTVRNTGRQTLTVRVEPFGWQTTLGSGHTALVYAIGPRSPELRVEASSGLMLVCAPEGVDAFFADEHPRAPLLGPVGYGNLLTSTMAGCLAEQSRLLAWSIAARHCKPVSGAPGWPKRRVGALLKRYGRFARRSSNLLDALPPRRSVSAFDVLVEAHACILGHGSLTDLASRALLTAAGVEAGELRVQDMPLQLWLAPRVQAEARWIRRVVAAIAATPYPWPTELPLLAQTDWVHELEDFLDARFIGDPPKRSPALDQVFQPLKLEFKLGGQELTLTSATPREFMATLAGESVKIRVTENGSVRQESEVADVRELIQCIPSGVTAHEREVLSWTLDERAGAKRVNLRCEPGALLMEIQSA